MQTQNVTLSIPKDILQKAKLLAVKRGTSLSKLLSDALESLVSEEAGYTQAQRRHIAEMRRGYDLGTGGRSPANRDELHER